MLEASRRCKRAPKFIILADRFRLSSALTRDHLVSNAKILQLEKNQYRLRSPEALLIYSKKSSLNGQATGTSRVLKLYSTQAETNFSATQERSQLTAPPRPSARQNQSPGDPESSDAGNYTPRAPLEGSRTSG